MATLNNINTGSSKPTVTDSHIQRYEEIMKTGTLNSGTPVIKSSPQISNNNSGKSKISKVLSSIPKPKGIGNKLFIFTGKKKIIMDGGEKEVEKAKTIDANEIKKIQKEEDKKDEAKTVPLPVKVEEDKEAEKKLKKKIEIKDEKKEHKKTNNDEAPKGLIIGGAILLILWTIGWAYFLGYFSLFGL